MKYEYYEVIAASLFDIAPIDIFKKSREAIYRVPRQFCMKYRVEILSFNPEVSGARYNIDRTTVIHAQGKIDNYIETKDYYGELYNLFLINCERKNKTLDRGEFLKKVQSMGWFDYVKTVEQPLKELIEMVFRNDNEDNIREQLDICEEKINDLKYLYKIENEPNLKIRQISIPEYDNEENETGISITYEVVRFEKLKVFVQTPDGATMTNEGLYIVCFATQEPKFLRMFDANSKDITVTKYENNGRKSTKHRSSGARNTRTN